jgi:HEAT repeat protein
MGREVTERAAKDIKSKDAEKRLKAVESLSGWSRPEGAALLIQGLGDVDERVRAASASSLGSWGKDAEPARAALVKALDDPRLSVASEAAETPERALKVPEKDLVPTRLRILESGNRREVFLAARSLAGHAAAIRLVDPILAYIEAQFARTASPDYQTRDAARTSIEIGEAALERLVKVTEDRSIITALTNAARGFAQRNDIPLDALALYEPRPEGWAKLLVEQLTARDPRVLARVLFLMGRTAQSAGEVATWAPEAVRVEKHPESSVRSALVYALGEAEGLASDHIDVAVRALQGEADKSLRETAVTAIGEIGDRNQATPAAGKRLVAERATAALRAAIEKDPEKDIREKAARSLARLQLEPRAAIEILVPLTAAPYPDGVRAAALFGLESRGSAVRGAIDALRPLLEDPNEYIRGQAATAINLIERGAPAAASAAPVKSASAPAASAAPKAAAAPRDPQVEAKALEFLRSKKVTFEVNSFFGALSEQDLPQVQAFLDAGMDPNGRPSDDGDSPMSFLFRAGACSPLQRPTAAPVKDIMKLLLARGADVNLADSHGNTILMGAAMGGCDRETVGTLIKAGAKVDAKNTAGLSAFEMGLFSGHDGLEELIAAGYRLPADKAALFRQGYASNPKSLDLITKATAPVKK